MFLGGGIEAKQAALPRQSHMLVHPGFEVLVLLLNFLQRLIKFHILLQLR